MKAYAVVAQQTGGPDVLQRREWKIGDPAPGEVQLRQVAVGLNFIDTYFRGGVYPWKEAGEIIPGSEASGEVVAVGDGVTDFAVGDRVCYTLPNGAYVSHRNVPAERLLHIPDSISYQIAAATLLKGLTAYYLLFRTFPVKRGQKVLFHAAAGGVGLLAGQWGKHLGATMIGTVSTAEKARIAQEHGYAHLINYKEEDFVSSVDILSKGKGVDVVYDSVGKDTYPYSLQCLKRLGMWVCFGQSSGIIEDFKLSHLAQHGSLFATRPTLFSYIATREELREAGTSLFGALSNEILTPKVNQVFDLSNAAEAHRQLEGRLTKGSSILMV